MFLSLCHGWSHSVYIIWYDIIKNLPFPSQVSIWFPQQRILGRLFSESKTLPPAGGFGVCIYKSLLTNRYDCLPLRFPVLLNSGVPQGFILGPPVFDINEFCKTFRSLHASRVKGSRSQWPHVLGNVTLYIRSTLRGIQLIRAVIVAFNYCSSIVIFIIIKP